MISFKIITDETKKDILRQLENLSESEYESALEIVLSLSFDEDDVEYAISAIAGCLLVRVFDMGRYFFLYPYEISEDADVISAIDAVSEYAMREEIPLVFSDVPKDAVSSFFGFRHMDLDAEDECADSYRVRIKTECELVSEIPNVTRGRVTLNAISEEDVGEYARLCKDKNVNKYWGYDYSLDAIEPADEYFFDTACDEFARGISISMAIRTEDAFCGEAVIYAFDGKGAAEFAIRLLPEFHGRGLGVESVLAIADVAKSIGLTTLRSKIFSKNLPSVAMLKKVTDKWNTDGDTLIFTINLNKL